MNTKLRTEAKNDFEKDFFKVINNSIFGNTMENVRNHRDLKLITTNKRKNQLVLEPNYHTTKCFSENLLAIEMKKKIILKMNKPVYLILSILEISKTLMDKFWYNYINYASWILKPKTSIKISLVMLKKDLIHETIRKIIKDHF